MPFVSVRLLGDGITREQKAEVIQRITQTLVDVLDKDPAKTFVVIEEFGTDNWGVAGEQVTTLRERAAAG